MLKYLNRMLVAGSIPIAFWLVFHLFFQSAFRYENRDMTRTGALNTNEKMLMEVFRSVSWEEFASLFASPVPGIKSGDLPRRMFFSDTRLIFFVSSPRVCCASIGRAEDGAPPLGAGAVVMPLGGERFVFSRASLGERGFLILLLQEWLWGAGCALLLLQPGFLSAAWRRNRRSFLLFFGLNVAIGVVFLCAQPSLPEYCSQRKLKEIAYYRELLSARSGRSGDGGMLTVEARGERCFTAPRNAAGTGFRWVEMSPFEYLYQIDAQPESVLPRGRSDIAVTDVGDGFYLVAYWQEKWLWYGGFLPGCLMVWGILLCGAWRLLFLWRRRCPVGS